MIIIATYTANLAAALTTQKQQVTVTSLNDLKTYQFKFGTVANSAPATYLSTSANTASIKKNMVLYPTLTDAINALSKGDIAAVIWTSAILDYLVDQPPCNALEVGDYFNKGNYGIPFAKNSSYVDHFSSILLTLRETGVVDGLVTNWWTAQGSCSLVAATTTDGTMELDQLSGLFLLLGICIVVAFAFLFVEWGYYLFYHRTKHHTKVFSYLNRFLGGEKHDLAVNGGEEEGEKKLGHKSNIPPSQQSSQIELSNH